MGGGQGEHGVLSGRIAVGADMCLRAVVVIAAFVFAGQGRRVETSCRRSKFCDALPFAGSIHHLFRWSVLVFAVAELVFLAMELRRVILGWTRARQQARTLGFVMGGAVARLVWMAAAIMHSPHVGWVRVLSVFTMLSLAATTVLWLLARHRSVLAGDVLWAEV